jgi:hypothetical protein
VYRSLAKSVNPPQDGPAPTRTARVSESIGRTSKDVSPRDRDEEILFIRIDRMEEIVAHLQQELDRAEEAQRESAKALLAQERRMKALEERLERIERRLSEGADDEEFDGA